MARGRKKKKDQSLRRGHEQSARRAARWNRLREIAGVGFVALTIAAIIALASYERARPVLQRRHGQRGHPQLSRRLRGLLRRPAHPALRLRRLALPGAHLRGGGALLHPHPHQLREAHRAPRRAHGLFARARRPRQPRVRRCRPAVPRRGPAGPRGWRRRQIAGGPDAAVAGRQRQHPGLRLPAGRLLHARDPPDPPAHRAVPLDARAGGGRRSGPGPGPAARAQGEGAGARKPQFHRSPGGGDSAGAAGRGAAGDRRRGPRRAADRAPPAAAAQQTGAAAARAGPHPQHLRAAAARPARRPAARPRAGLAGRDPRALAHPRAQARRLRRQRPGHPGPPRPGDHDVRVRAGGRHQGQPHRRPPGRSRPGALGDLGARGGPDPRQAGRRHRAAEPHARGGHAQGDHALGGVRPRHTRSSPSRSARTSTASRASPTWARCPTC